MGARKCVVPGCNSCTTRPEDKGLTYHRFPVYSREEWLKIFNLPKNFQTTKNTHVCSRHFNKSDFQEFKGKKFFLKHGALPKPLPSTADNKSDEIPSTSGEIAENQDKTEESTTTKMEVDVPTDPETTKPKEDKKDDKKPPKSQSKTKLPPFSPKKTRKSAAMKRLSETHIAEPSKKVPRNSLPAPSPASAAKKLNFQGKSEPSTSAAAQTTTADSTKVPPASPKKKNSIINFVPGNLLQAQDFGGKWMSAKVIEVDTEEREVLIRFEKSAKSKNDTG